MATSSKVQFKLDTLREEALEAVNRQIQRQCDLIDSYDDEETLGERIKEWREHQEERVTNLYLQLTDSEQTVSDHQLAAFKIQPVPDNGERHERIRAERELRRLQDLQDTIVAKSKSLVPDEDGNIALTKTQLAEFFGL